MTQAKVENYSAELSATISEQFKAGMPVAEIANLAGKSLKSVVAKLSRLGVYTAKVYVPKTGGTVQTKEQIVDSIAVLMGVPADSIGSLASGTKAALLLVSASLKASALAVQAAQAEIAEMEKEADAEFAEG